MRVLITGGLGYIGSSISGFFDDVTIVDNMHTQRYCSLVNRRFKFKHQSFETLTTEELKDFDFVIHLAAIVDAANSEKQKDLVELVNIKYTGDLVKKCEDAQVNFVFPSSTSVYGVAKDIVKEDDDSVINPQSPYAESKIYIENIIKKSNLDYVILRFGTVCGYSTGIRFQTAINKFCLQACLGEPLTVWKDNYELVRPFLSICDLNSFVSRCIYNWNEHKNQTYNILSDNICVKDVISIIKKHKSSVKINFVDCPLLNQYSYHVSNEKSKSIIKPRPEMIPLEIADMIKIYSND